MQETKNKSLSIALVGNPNAGKSTIFNSLCGHRQKTANYPGATVDLKSGKLKIDSQELTVIDLPGLYSLQATSQDEKIALDLILGHSSAFLNKQPDLILNIVDVSNLKRNLFLYSQLSELNVPIIIILTMWDILERNDQYIDLEKFKKEIGVRVVLVQYGNSNHIKKLKKTIVASIENPNLPKATIEFPGMFKKAVDDIYSKFNKNGIKKSEIITGLLGNRIKGTAPDLNDCLDEQTLHLKKNNFKPVALTIRRYKWIDSILSKVDAKNLEKKSTNLATKLDSFLTHRFFGMFVFSSIMFFIFQSIYAWSEPMMDAIDFFFSWFGTITTQYLQPYPVIQSLIRDGVITGIGSVVIFLPQILFLFLFIAILEDSGYMARAAFLMDRLLGWAGLNGRAFIPMLSSFACAVPGVMSARVMSNEKARFTTVLVAPLMSCSARLPVYVLLIGALIEPLYGAMIAAATLFFFHLLGLFIALPVAFILNKGILKTKGTPFLLELPEYRMPELKNIMYRVFHAGKKFLKQAGTIIFAMTILIWAMSYFPRPKSIETKVRISYAEELNKIKNTGDKQSAIHKMENEISAAYLEQSYLGRFGTLLQPAFEPLGFNWKITVGIISAFPAREVIIATLGIIYSVGEVDEESTSLRENMLLDKNPDGSRVFTPLVAISLMIFFALSSQCMSTLAVVYRELKSWKWTAFLFFYMTALAYLLSLIVYQGGRFLGFS